MEKFLTLSMAGLATGGIYGLMAIGIVLIFRATNIVNFAQGELLTAGAYVYLETRKHTSNPVVQILVVLLAGVVLGVIFYIVVHVLLRRAREHLHIIIGTLALSIIIVNLVQEKYTVQAYRTPAWLIGDRYIRAGASAIPYNSVTILVIGVVSTAGLYLWFARTRSGRSVRAVAENQEFAALSGISVRNALLVSWGLGCAFAAVSGMLLAPAVSVYPTMGQVVLFKGFVAATIGGFTNPAAAMTGALGLGLLESLTAGYMGSDITVLISFGALLLLLLLRPEGIVRKISVVRV